jgi:phosphatidate cytidylyltransferase
MFDELVIRSTVAAAAVLGGAGVTIATIETARRRSLASSILATRWKTWTVLAAFWMVGLASPLLLFVVLAAMSLAVASEYARLACLDRTDRRTALALPVVVLSLLALGLDYPVVLTVALLAVTAGPLLEQDVEHGPQRVGRVLLGLVLTALAPAAIWLIGRDAAPVLVALLFGVALSDVAAFTMGSTLGRRRLAPRLSPAKTWEGAVGNLVGATAGVAIAAAATDLAWAAVAVLGPIIALGSLWGDLLESMVKRAANVKDAGSILPGFGGVLDRVDSLIAAAPLTWVMLPLLGGAL